MTRRIFITWALIFSLLTQGLVPVFASQSTASASSAAYQRSYAAYIAAVESNAPHNEINAKHKAYLAAKAAYESDSGLGTTQADSGFNAVSAPSSQQQADSAVTSVELSEFGDQLADGVSETEQSKKFWHGIRDFQSKVVSNALRLVGGASAPGQMPLWERIAWTIGRSLLPTMGVVVATALLAPLSPIAMVIGGVITGAALAGTMTYAYEKRMNAKYREVKKEEAKIWRDVSVQAAVEAVMAPFNMATGGLFGMVGPTIGNAIGKVAISQAIITFAGRTVSSQVGGAVKNLWAKKYFKYPEKIEAYEARIDEILDSRLASETPFSPEEIEELDRLRKEVEMMRGEMYSKEDAVKDLKRAGVASLISGFAGSIISDRAYNSTFGRYADQASVKLFGSVARGKSISSLFSTMPVNFGSGMAGASLEKSFVGSEIDKLRKEQSRHNKGSPIYDYYERVIEEKNKKKDSIDATKAGFDTMMNSFAVQAAKLTVDSIKYNVYDGPRARKAAVQELYRDKNPEWQKANQLQTKYEDLKAKAPNPLTYRSPVAYARAVASHKKIIDQARDEWLSQMIVAERSDSRADNIVLRSEIENKYDRDRRLNQTLELGRLKGGDAHLDAMKKVLKEKNPELADASDEKLATLAALAIRQTYYDKFEDSSQKASNIEDLFEKRRQLKEGKIDLTREEAKLLEGRASAVSPSQYKAALVEKYVYELKAKNTRWEEVERHMPAIIKTAERQMLQQYDNNWVKVLTAEAYANGLARYKYDPEGRVAFSDEMKKLVTRIPDMIKNNLVGEYSTKVNKAIVDSILPR